MLSKLLQLVVLTACLTPAWAKSTSELSFIRQPSTVSVVGPGTVLSVHLLDLPFVKPRYAVKYKTDGGRTNRSVDSREGRFGSRRDVRDTDLLHPS